MRFCNAVAISLMLFLLKAGTMLAERERQDAPDLIVIDNSKIIAPQRPATNVQLSDLKKKVVLEKDATETKLIKTKQQEKNIKKQDKNITKDTNIFELVELYENFFNVTKNGPTENLRPKFVMPHDETYSNHPEQPKIRAIFYKLQRLRNRFLNNHNNNNNKNKNFNGVKSGSHLKPTHLKITQVLQAQIDEAIKNRLIEPLGKMILDTIFFDLPTIPVIDHSVMSYITDCLYSKLLSFFSCKLNLHNVCCDTPGPVGPPGPTGSTGNSGSKGNTGDQGATGSPGDKGSQGQTGTKGDDGTPGFKGDMGSSGMKGEVGNTGNPGDKGVPGPPGADGTPGNAGQPGPKGEQGVKGDTGDQGSKGTTGDKGSNGAPGTPGTTGSPGPPGPKGDTGAPGSTGPKGAQGVCHRGCDL